MIWLLLVCCFAVSPTAQAATGRVIKVLPEYLDLKGQNTVFPTLYDRDTYQVTLRQHPELRSGLRFYVQWKTKGGVFEPVKLRLELRGVTQGNLPKQLVLESPGSPGGWFSHWTNFTVTGNDYKNFGEVTAWRATLWEGGQLLGEQKSFLW